MLEDLIESVGSSGKFQWMVVFLIMSSKMVFGMSMLIMSYGGMIPDWWCISKDDETVSIDSMNSSSIYYQTCNATSVCSRRYESYTVTVVSKFDLVCDNAWIKPTVTSIQMGGVLVGAFIGGQSGDTFGRKKTIYAAILLHSIFNIIAAFSVNWQMFAAFRFLIGGSLGTYLVLVVYPLEFIGLKRRALASSLPFWTIGVLFLALATYLIHDWKTLHILIGALTFPFVLGWFVVPESLRWLATKGKIEEAKVVLDKIARFNGTKVPDNAEAILRKVAEIERQSNEGEKKYTYIDIYRGFPMIKKSLCLNYIWFSCSAIYYGFSFGVSNFSGNFYLNFFLMNVIELSAFVPVIYLLGKIGRRYTCVFALFLAASSCIAALIAQEVNDVSKSPFITGVSLLAKILTGGSWVALILLTNESYPTVIRYLGYGASNTMARIGGILAPFIFSLGSHRIIPYVIMAVLMVTSGICGLTLQETKDLAMADLIENDVEMDIKETEKSSVYKISRSNSNGIASHGGEKNTISEDLKAPTVVRDIEYNTQM
ncbi:hypothetical protein SNE40_000973 [Patella caerulea]|uniref:Major facilitator superfamily (MFS) profile domain-containing protein n=1 Tax=Patella caerulea TaxID=87958 RepID=A0AAN8QHL2_PATCE